MEWRGRRQSNNVEDRRLSGSGGSSGRRGASVGGGLGLVAIVVVGWFFGVDLTPLLNGGGTQGPATNQGPLSADEQAAGDFVAVTLADTEEIWAKIFQEQIGQTYDPATLVLYRGVPASGCGDASGATGPFYCPQDQKVYLDTEFFDTMANELGAKGDFAMAYVVAHEIGHHVQDELGILTEANTMRARVSEADSNAISVRIELQADCLAGIWGREVQAQFGVIQPGDFEEAFNAARKIGDDTLQRNAGRVPMPDSFTHGTSAQRSKWFKIGLDTGELSACDTFAIKTP
ncbi:MAG: neutral zinc metallopeptidase [Candidatus Saccharibacteria bacterium]|nr:neutral zinc metallopeptidase [Pseudorhodobacter sp.]